MLNASDAGRSGSSAISAAKKNAKSAAPQNKNLIRFQNDRGLRVARSLSRGRLSNSVVATCVMSLVLHRPGVDDTVDLRLVLVVAVGGAIDADRVHLRRGL